MNREKIIWRLNHLADHSINIQGETPYTLSLDDGIALKEAAEIIALEKLPSAQSDLLDDGTLMITVPQGMLEKVKRVLVDEVGTKFCKTMY